MFVLFGILLMMYGALWLFSGKKYELDYGISFNQNHAESLGLEWRQVYSELLEEFKPKYIRIAAMWSQVEKEKGVYDFEDIDFMMNVADEYNTKILLVVGQKAPRWPECHVPRWLSGYADSEAKEHLLNYVSAVVEQYKDHPALELWQVENEPFIRFDFGECDGFDEDSVFEEIDLVRRQDPKHKIVITDSGELSTWGRASKVGDIFGTTLYRVVQTPGGKIWTYNWLPAGFYRFKARMRGMKYENFFVSELQAEPWFTNATPIDTPVEEQEKTMSPKRLQKHIAYVENVGASRAYLWGVEWWYWMKEMKGDSRYWEMIQSVFNE